MLESVPFFGRREVRFVGFSDDLNYDFERFKPLFFLVHVVEQCGLDCFEVDFLIYFRGFRRVIVEESFLESQELPLPVIAVEGIDVKFSDARERFVHEDELA